MIRLGESRMSSEYALEVLDVRSPGTSRGDGESVCAFGPMGVSSGPAMVVPDLMALWDGAS